MNRMETNRRPVVLVVDDEEAVREFAGFVLGSHDYEVISARNSVEALHIAAGFKGGIDVLLTDIHMRIFQNGLELASCFNVLRPETRILLMSGSDLPEDCLGYGDIRNGWNFLPKPFSAWQLLEAVESLAGCEGVYSAPGRLSAGH
jgi:two-component system, cell cycle sensor histidine kinase and response regulator CckA